MHPYSGDHTDYPTDVNLPDDGTDAPSFTIINTAPEALANRSAYLRTLANAAAAGNWGPWNPNPKGVATGDTAYLTAACWDSWFGQWLVGGLDVNAGSACLTLATVDGGKIWQSGEHGGIVCGLRQIDAPDTFAPLAMAVDPEFGTLCAVCNSVSAPGAVVSQALAGVAPIITAQPFMPTVSKGTMLAAGGAFLFVGAVASAGSYVGVFAQSSGGSGLWTNWFANLPVSWQSGAGTVGGLVSAYNGMTDASSVVLIGLSGVTAGTDTSRIMQGTQAGYVDLAPTFLSSGARLVGLAYSTTDALFGAMTWDGGAAYVYTSPDGTAWILAATFHGCYASGLSTIGSVWAVCLVDTTTADPGNRIWYSGNVSLGAASTWCPADYFDPFSMAVLPTSLASLTLPLLISSGDQLLRIQPGSSPFVGSPGPGSNGGSVAVSHRSGLVPAGVF